MARMGDEASGATPSGVRYRAVCVTCDRVVSWDGPEDEPAKWRVHRGQRRERHSVEDESVTAPYRRFAQVVDAD
jgi:hypothetical protein